MVCNIMFDSIATLFSTPIIARSYEQRPSLAERCRRKSVKRYGRVQQHLDKQSEDILESLHKPVQTWIIQKQPHLRSNALNMQILKMIALRARNRQLVEASSNNNKSAIIHNLFVLIVQYKILNERIKEAGSGDLQIFMNGLCGIYIEEEGPLDQLTCLLHFIVSSCKLHQCDNLKGNISLFRPLQLHLNKMDHFFQVYSKLQQKYEKFIDIVVNVIPMMTELCKIIVKNGDGAAKVYFLQILPWISKIGIVMITTIQKDTEDVVASRKNEPSDQITNPSLRERLFEKGAQLLQIEGIIANKVLFSFAYKQLYYFQHALKLHRYMMEMAVQSDSLASEQRQHNLKLVNVLLKAVGLYEFNLPDTSIQSIGNILNATLSQGSEQSSEIMCYSELRSSRLQEFIEDIKCSPIYQIHSDGQATFNEEEYEQFQFYLEKDESIVSSILEMVFNLKLEYLQLLKIMLKKINKNYLQNLQLYLIKNGLLHFLIQELQSIQSNDKKLMENYFKVLASLLQKNTIAYCILNEIIVREIKENEKSALSQYIRKHFVHSKEFLLSLLTDTISINSKKSTLTYFLPHPLQALLYPSDSQPKHDIWISYIHDVILRELSSKRQKQKMKKMALNQQINEWTMLAILIQIENMICIKGSDLQLGQFTMAYLTNVLKQAIKWKYEDETEVMRKLLTAYEEWETYYTAIISENGEEIDVIEQKWGPTINFTFLMKWNRKICNSIKLFIESVTNIKTVDDIF